RSHERGHAVGRADMHALPFADRTFAAVRADRVVQHVADPHRAFDELVRVTSGRIVVADPDQSTLSIVVPGAPAALVDAVTRLRAQVGYRNGTFIREVVDTFDERDDAELTVDEFTLALTNPDDAFGLPTWVDYWRAEGEFTDADVRVWDDAMQRAREAGGFEFALQYVVVAATV
ncbi:MAG TPA: methyltransferase domain-containing protein, partial [Acidimicrobiia bacterium]|nr:methyltransferase domain-containing protein [Acidimicrobiia bacterium]